MALTVTEHWQGPSVSTQLDDNGITGSSSMTRKYHVLASDSSYNVNQVLAAGGLPRPGDAHPSNFALRVRSRSVSQTSPVFFEVDITYTAKVSEPEDEAADNPLEQPAKIEWSAITTEEPIDEDKNGDPISTVNGEPIVGLTMPLTDLQLSVTRNLPSFSGVSIMAYTNKVNSATFAGFPAGTVRIADIKSTNVAADGYEYWQTTIVFHIRRGIRVANSKAWWKRVKHEGYYVKVGSDVKRAVDDDGNQVVTPVPLKTDGTEETDKSVAHYLEFEVFDTIDFNALNLL